MKLLLHNPAQLILPFPGDKEKTLDMIISVVCERLQVDREELSRHDDGTRSTRRVARAKKIISYLNPIYAQVDYRLLMERLGYGENTKSRHTRNRQEVMSELNTNPEFKEEMNHIKHELTDKLFSEVIHEIQAIIEQKHLELNITIKHKDKSVCLNRGIY